MRGSTQKFESDVSTYTGTFNPSTQNDELLNTLKSKQEAKVKQLQERIQKQREEKILATKKARDEARKNFLILKSKEEVITMLDELIEKKNTFILNMMWRDMQKEPLKTYVKGK